MQFSYFNQFLPKIKKIDLPGLDAQLLLAPDFRKESLKTSYNTSHAKKAGVMILFYPDQNDQTHVVLILRKSYKGVHSNQVALPGGKVEKEDADLVETALRETEEEIGVKASTIEVIRPMTELYIPPSNYIVQPTLGKVDYLPDFKPQITEVEKIIPVKLEDLLLTSNIKPGLIKTTYAGQKKVMSYQVNGYTIWGATAMMLSELQVLLKNAEL
jgi:8-oxo-dGTP pyrophosphatase MutT (NUDIX family)